MVTCPFVSGILSFLEELKSKKIKTFLLSATPHEELLEICRFRKIDFFFQRILGAPTTKVQHGKKILSDLSLKSHQVIFFGDSTSDLEASQELGINFIGVGDKYNNLFPKNVNIIKNFERFTFEHL